MIIQNPEALDERANNLGTFNGIKLVLVTLTPAAAPTQADLRVEFFNNQVLSDILNEIAADADALTDIFQIKGGHRIVGGLLNGQVRVTAASADAADDTVLNLTVAPIGDYSTYTLNILHQNIDPVFSTIAFKFRPGCFNNCAPEWEPADAALPNPAIDYLAKDYDSFVHTLVAWMMDQVPNWQPTSEASLDMVLVDLFSAAADELSDYQDRVMNVAYLATARQRVSLARHARLMDYHIHQGNQASTWLAVAVQAAAALNAGVVAWTGEDDGDAPGNVLFMTRADHSVHPLLNAVRLYTWSDTAPALSAGTTQADLQLDTNTKTAAVTIRDLMRSGDIPYLLVQEDRNPQTGEVRGRDPKKRQLLRLKAGDAAAEVLKDPVKNRWILRVFWEDVDALQYDYCFSLSYSTGKVDRVSQFYGNLLKIYEGRPVAVDYKDPADVLSASDYAYDRDEEGVATLELAGRLAYTDTAPGGDVPPRSTLLLDVETGGQIDPWDEVADLVHSDDSSEGGDHFVVETDEYLRSYVRFGDGINGRKLPDGAVVHCAYQQGGGLVGNVGRDTIRHVDSTTGISEAWNPFDVTNGREPEPVAQIIRRVPEAYRYHQLRAVTLQDYVDRAEEVSGVSRAQARYFWTGSWRTVRVAIDPSGTNTLSEALRTAVFKHLDAVRLIGEDLEIRPPRFAALEIEVGVCVKPGYEPQDVREYLERAFSTGYLPDGTPAFLHPNNWTFGQSLHASQIMGVVQAVDGVDHVTSLSMKRRDSAVSAQSEVIKVEVDEIILVENDPDHMERGSIHFDVRGGQP
jgi:hypothetical protein